mmetsp:Transcript_135871/g.247121  ORF Transcript_135871/g.247121 Transcript_135871/m.247121 type:complete len:126 (-) Transcript_135871:3-380(-)
MGLGVPASDPTAENTEDRRLLRVEKPTCPAIGLQTAENRLSLWPEDADCGRLRPGDETDRRGAPPCNGSVGCLGAMTLHAESPRSAQTLDSVRQCGGTERRPMASLATLRPNRAAATARRDQLLT